MVLIGVDIGGTKVSVCLGDHRGNIYEEERTETKSLGAPNQGLPIILRLIGKLLDRQNLKLDDVQAMGLAAPGPISFEKGMMLHPPNLPNWINVPIQKFFVDQLKKPVFFNNDGNAGALAHWEFGLTKKPNTLIYLTMSTGMGGGIIANGELLQGGTDTAGEVGHFVLDPKGPKCPCGQRGCFEVFCGGANLAYRIGEEIRKKSIKTKILEEAKGKIESINMQCLAAAVEKKDEYATEIWETFIQHLAQGVGILLMTFNPDVIILGTIAFHLKKLVMAPLREALKNYAWSIPIEHCLIEASRLTSQISQLSSLALAITGLKDSKL